MLKRIYSRIYSKIIPALWKKDARGIRKIILKSENKPIVLSLEGKVLILAPHSDDEWIGCFALIENYDCVICYMDMPGDNDDDTRKIRFDEIHNIANMYNKELLTVEQNKIESLRNIINNVNPSYIAVPFFVDWHKEHFMTMKILKQALSCYDGSIVCYQVSCPIPMSFVTNVFPLTKDDLKRKWCIFKDNYKTQERFPYKRFKELERAEGGYIGAYAANVFSIFSVKKWLESFNLVPSADRISKISATLNKLKELFLLINGNK